MNMIRLLALGAMLVVAACEKPTPEPIELLTVSGLETVIVAESLVVRETVFDGQIEAVNQSTVSAQTAGRIERLPFDVGDTVEQGDLIIEISAREQQARVGSATAAVAEAKARRQEAQAQYKRVDELHQQALVAKAEFDGASANLSAAKANLESAQAALDEASQAASYTEVYAPYTGLVVAKHVEVGESVSVGSPLMTGLSLEQLRAAVEIPQAHMPALREHRQARVILPDGRSVEVAQLRLPPNADPNTHTFKVLARLPPEQFGVFPGNLVKVAFISGEQQQLLLPDKALVRRGEVSGTYVLDADGRLRFRYVRVGSQTSSGDWPVLSGLSAGEQVATDPIAASQAYRGFGV